jgi:hypothetical protein
MRTVEGKFKGPKLVAILEELKKQANEHHHEATKNWGSSLEHVRLAGKALQEAFERLGRRSKWGKWLHRNFEGSARLSRDYRRIWRDWESPLLVKARSEGLQISSIQGVLKVLRGAVLGKDVRQDADATLNLQSETRSLKQDFSRKLRRLNPDELTILCEHFGESIWSRICEALKSYVREELGDGTDPSDHIRQTNVRMRIHAALNLKLHATSIAVEDWI